MTDGPPARHRTRTRPLADAAAPHPSDDGFVDADWNEGDYETSASGRSSYPFPTARSLMPGESANHADEISEYLLRTIQPRPGVERMITESIISQTREIAVLESARSRLVRLMASEFIKEKLFQMTPQEIRISIFPDLEELCNRWISGDPAAVEEVDERLEVNAIRGEDILIDAFARNIGEMGRLADIIARAEHRRDKQVRTLQGGRAMDAALAIRALQGQQLEMRIAQQRITSATDTDNRS